MRKIFRLGSFATCAQSPVVRDSANRANTTRRGEIRNRNLRGSSWDQRPIVLGLSACPSRVSKNHLLSLDIGQTDSMKVLRDDCGNCHSSCIDCLDPVSPVRNANATILSDDKSCQLTKGVRHMNEVLTTTLKAAKLVGADREKVFAGARGYPTAHFAQRSSVVGVWQARQILHSMISAIPSSVGSSWLG